MKIKNLIILTVLVLVFSKFLFAQDPIGSYEILITNSSTIGITVTVIPVSLLMSYITDADGHLQYTLEAAHKYRNYNPPHEEYDYITTVYKDDNGVHPSHDLAPNASFAINFDEGASLSDCQSVFGFGIYNIVIKWYENNQWNYDTCRYEQDAGENYDCGFIFVNDLQNYHYPNFTGGRTGRGLTYSIIQPNEYWGPQIDVNYTNHYVKCWQPYSFDPSRPTRQKDFGNFYYGVPSGSNHINYTVIPIDPREECNNTLYTYQNHSYDNDKQTGNLSLN